MDNRRLISIIIPTFNEKEDVRLSLEAALRFTYPYKEIIVVDDSTDHTPAIIREYEQRGVRLIRRPDRADGCCGARNLGIQEAKGKIVVLLNADVFPDADFLDRILRHYREGSADYVLVKSTIANQEYLFPRFLEAQHRYRYEEQSYIEWTEAFSCWRQAALDVGLLPGGYPIAFCRDWLLGLKLREKFRKVFDPSIVVPNLAPQSWHDFWRNRRDRAKFSVLFHIFIGTVDVDLLKKGGLVHDVIRRRSLGYLVFRSLTKHIWMLGEVICVFPILLKSWRLIQYSPYKSDLVPFWLAYALQTLALILGEWQGYTGFLLNGKGWSCISRPSQRGPKRT